MHEGIFLTQHNKNNTQLKSQFLEKSVPVNDRLIRFNIKENSESRERNLS